MNETTETPAEQTNENVRPESVIMVWNTSDEYHYWEHFDSIEDAVSTHGDGVEIFRAVPKRLGKYKKTVRVVRMKARKKRKVVA